MRRDRQAASVAVVLLALLALGPKCDEGDAETARERELRLAAERARAGLAEARRRVVAERERTRTEMERSRKELEQERERAREEADGLKRQADLERRRTEAAETDFSVAVAVSFSAVLATFVILHLLLRELTARKALGRFLRHLTGRDHRS